MTTSKKSRDFNLGVLCTVLFVVTACSDASKEERAQDHVWKEQVKTLERARGAQQTVIDGSKTRDAQIENETSK